MIHRCWSARVDFDDALTFDVASASDAALRFAAAEYQVKPFTALTVFVLDANGVSQRVPVRMVPGFEAGQGMAEAVSTEGR